ncbi:MAG: YfhO family protein [Schleiferiaceae bacterium]|jgi:hypothetical protein|nr:YfhO family protein [Schleiferiaceae bacterium]
MNILKNLKVHLIVLAALFVITAIYFLPAYSGKVLQQDDIQIGVGKSKEILDYRAEHHEEPLWTNSMFSGMPAFQLNVFYPSNIFEKLERGLKSPIPGNTALFVMLFLGMYIMLVSLKVNPWLAGIGSLAFAFSAFFIISFAAGHNAKLRAAGYIAPMLGGILLTLNGKKLYGAALTALFLGLAISANHLQITYYSALIVLVILITYGVAAFKAKELKSYFMAVAFLAGAALIAIIPNTSKLWTTYEFTQETIRGGKSELATKEEQKGGLDKEYAFRWSYSGAEMFNLVIPDFTGGGSKQNYEGTQIHELYFKNIKANLQKDGYPSKQAEAQANAQIASMFYWGSNSMVHGGYYLGAIMFFFFVLAFFVAPKNMKVWVGVSVAWSVFMALGSNFMTFNELMFDYFPIFNKFRVPSMALTICFVLVPAFGIYGADRLLKMENKNEAKKILLKSFYVAGGFFLFFALLGPMLFDFTTTRDDAYQNNPQLLDMLISDREDLMRNTSFRSLLFTAGAFGLMFFSLNGKLKTPMVLGGLAVLVMIDMFGFDRQHISHDDFMTKRDYNAPFRKSTADNSILNASNNPMYYRVLNLNNPFNDGFTSYYHKSIGGYHGAKLQRYQDLFETQIINEMQSIIGPLQQGQNPAGAFASTPVLNMLNDLYVIYNPQAPALRNPNALGNAWFINELKVVPNGDAEIKGLSGINPATTALIKEENAAYATTKNFNGQGTIDLTSYAPNKLVYSANTSADQFAVFSDVYYRDGKDWKVTIDGNEVKHTRVNYVLRGLNVPSGNHEIIFEFKPAAFFTGETISLIGSVLFALLLIAASIKYYKGEKEEVLDAE